MVESCGQHEHEQVLREIHAIHHDPSSNRPRRSFVETRENIF
jgi:hypothetical protein